MFTGIVEELGTVTTIINQATLSQITIAANKILSDITIGDSIAVNGTCLTVVRFTEREFTADVMPETLRVTVLGKLRRGSVVNLERALTLNSRLGGHIVSGHVDGLGEIIKRESNENAVLITVKVAENLAKYIIVKGSVTLDGISLTIVDCGLTYFTVSLIPHTAAVTTLGFKTKGDLVNVENDLIGKYVERLMLFQSVNPVTAATTLTREFLKNNGF